MGVGLDEWKIGDNDECYTGGGIGAGTLNARDKCIMKYSVNHYLNKVKKFR